MRIGHGFDIHRFGGSNPLIIGGVLIPFEKGVIAHSDGDVMLHAVIDSLLGAVALGDIGKFFPDTDMKYNNISSRKLLRIIWNKIVKDGYILGNLDITVIIQFPRISKYVSQMCRNLIEDFNCHKSLINIKSKTAEKLGCIGRSEGFACESLVLLIQKKVID